MRREWSSHRCIKKGENASKVRCSFTAPVPCGFVSGESIFYRGVHYRLKVLPGESGNVKLWNGWLQIPVKEGKQQATRVRAALVAWYCSKAETRLPERVEEWHSAVKVPMPAVVIANRGDAWAAVTEP